MSYQEEAEDYAGQLDERRRVDLVKRAVEAADRIIMDGAEFGALDCHEIDYLTSAVAHAFMQKVHGRLMANLNSAELRRRMRERTENSKIVKNE
jgi:hypothetical protein